MRQDPKSIPIAVLVIALATQACGVTFDLGMAGTPSATPGTPFAPTETPGSISTSTLATVHDIYAGFTGSGSMPFIMIHNTGEALTAMQDPDTSTVLGSIWISADGTPVAIYADANGRATSIVVGDDVILYTNYSDDSVDLTVVHKDGSREEFSGQPDTDLIEKITAFNRTASSNVALVLPPSRLAPEPLDGKFWLKTGLYMLSSAVCVGGVAAAVQTGTIVLPPVFALLASACSGAILGAFIRAGQIAHMDVGWLEDMNLAVNIIKCQLPEPLSLANCLSAMVKMSEDYDDSASQKASKAKTPPTLANLRGTVTEVSNCRYGPGAPYLYKYGLASGTEMEIIGRDADGNWLQVQAIGGTNPCWIKATQIQADGDVLRLKDAYPQNQGLPISPFFPQLVINTSVGADGSVNVEWQDHEIREDLDTEQGIEYIVEVWTCVNGKPDFTPIGIAPQTLTSATFQIDNSCGFESHADVIGEDKEGFSIPAQVPLH